MCVCVCVCVCVCLITASQIHFAIRSAVPLEEFNFFFSGNCTAVFMPLKFLQQAKLIVFSLVIRCRRKSLIMHFMTWATLTDSELS